MLHITKNCRFLSVLFFHIRSFPSISGGSLLSIQISEWDVGKQIPPSGHVAIPDLLGFYMKVGGEWESLSQWLFLLGGVATGFGCVWSRAESKGWGPRGDSVDFHSARAPAQPCSGPGVPNSEASWVQFSKESIPCLPQGAVVGNGQCTFCYLNPGRLASASLKQSGHGHWSSIFLSSSIS